MIEIKHELISGIPVIELFPSGKEGETLPLVFFYHGWESHKERCLEHGCDLAEQGFRAVLPEALEHGERIYDSRNLAQANNPLHFWEIVSCSVREFPVLIEYYSNKKKILTDRIGVAGLSMGGMTVSAILAQYDFVKSAAILMGSPSPIDFTNGLFKNFEIDGVTIYDLWDLDKINNYLEGLKPLSLKLQADKINNRPVYFWHGEEDDVVPISLTKQFVEEHKKKSYGQNIVFDTTEGVGHKVPRETSIKMAKFFEENL